MWSVIFFYVTDHRSKLGKKDGRVVFMLFLVFPVLVIPVICLLEVLKLLSNLSINKGKRKKVPFILLLLTWQSMSITVWFSVYKLHYVWVTWHFFVTEVRSEKCNVTSINLTVNSLLWTPLCDRHLNQTSERKLVFVPVCHVFFTLY